MNKSIRIVLSILAVVFGWISIGVGYTTQMGHPLSTFLFLLGIAAFVLGLKNLINGSTSKVKRE